MIPIIPSLLVLWYTGKTFSVLYFAFNFLLTLYVYYKSTKFYFPNMKDKKAQYFHENYKVFERNELFMLSLVKIYHGLLNYVWFKFFLQLFWFVSYNLGL